MGVGAGAGCGAGWFSSCNEAAEAILGRRFDETDIPLLARIDGADPLDVVRRMYAHFGFTLTDEYLDELAAAGRISRGDLLSLREAATFLARVRTDLHLTAGRRRDGVGPGRSGQSR